MSITNLFNEQKLHEILFKRNLPELERKVEELDIIIDYVDWRRVCTITLTQEETYNTSLVMHGQEEFLGCFSKPGTREYVRTMQNLEKFIRDQGPEPLALYGLEKFPTVETPFETPIIVANGVWRGINEYRR